MAGAVEGGTASASSTPAVRPLAADPLLSSVPPASLPWGLGTHAVATPVLSSAILAVLGRGLIVRAAAGRGAPSLQEEQQQQQQQAGGEAEGGGAGAGCHGGGGIQAQSGGEKREFPV